MNATTTESASPLGDSRMANRRARISHLARIIFEQVLARFWGRTGTDFDDSEDASLLAASWSCRFYAKEIVPLNFDESFVIQVEGIDGHNYMIQFSLLGPGFSIHAARVRITKLSLLEAVAGGESSAHNTLEVQPEYSRRLKLGKVSTDHAFLIGMSLVIGFMDDLGDDPDEDARLAPLSAQIMLSDDELREVRAKLPPSTINYDDEGEMPY